jgi:hypothetical protein
MHLAQPPRPWQAISLLLREGHEKITSRFPILLESG